MYLSDEFSLRFTFNISISTTHYIFVVAVVVTVSGSATVDVVVVYSSDNSGAVRHYNKDQDGPGSSAIGALWHLNAKHIIESRQMCKVWSKV